MSTNAISTTPTIPLIPGIAGQFYHIRDQFFIDVQEPKLMSNKENGGYRPHYLAVHDLNNVNIFWMIPVSSKFIKYQDIYNHQLSRYGKCTKIVLGKCAGWDAAYLIQNSFPITADYFDHVHTSKGKPLTIHESTASLILRNLNHNLLLKKKGINLFFADIDSIYNLMVNHLNILSK